MHVHVLVFLAAPPRIAPPWRLAGVRSESVFLLSVSFFFRGAAVRLESLLARVVIGNSSQRPRYGFSIRSYVSSAFRRTHSECHGPWRSGQSRTPRTTIASHSTIALEPRSRNPLSVPAAASICAHVYRRPSLDRPARVRSRCFGFAPRTDEPEAA